MKIAPRLLIASVIYAVSLTIAGSALCYLSIRKCQIGENLTLGEIAVPLLVAFGGLLLVGLVVSVLLLLVDRLFAERNTIRSTTIRFLAGVAVGIFPMFVWYLAKLGAHEAFYPRMDYLPLAIGGMFVSLTYLLTAPSKGRAES